MWFLWLSLVLFLICPQHDPELILSLADSVLAQHPPSMNLGDALSNDYIEVSGSQVCYLILQLELQPLTSSWVRVLQAPQSQYAPSETPQHLS